MLKIMENFSDRLTLEGAGGQTSDRGTDKEIREKRNFSVNRSVTKNFQWENFPGPTPRKSLCTQHSQTKCNKCLDLFLAARSWVSTSKCGPLAKIRALKKIPPPQLSKLSLTTQTTFSHKLWEEVICVVRQFR